MPQPKVSDNSAVAEALLTASLALVAVAARSLAAVDEVVTLPQYRALVVLAAKGPQNVGELADALTIHPSTATRLCDRLVAKKLVRRVHSRASRRETTISLSDSGKDLVDQVTALRRREIDHIVGRIPAAVRPSLIAALTTFAEAAGEIPDQSWLLGWS